MEKFTYTINISAKDKTQSIQIMQAVTNLIKKLSTDQLTYLAELTAKKPGWIEKAKPYESFL